MKYVGVFSPKYVGILSLKIMVIFFFVLAFNTVKLLAQSKLIKQNIAYKEINPEIQKKLLSAIDTLFDHIITSKVTEQEIAIKDSSFTRDLFYYIKAYISSPNGTKKPITAHLVNLYPLSSNSYLFSTAFVNRSDSINTLIAIINLTAELENSVVMFHTPLSNLTKTWKTSRVGNISYHYANKLNIPRANKFDKENTMIASKLGLKAEKLDFYLSENYQQILHLLGFDFQASSSGNSNYGYGIDHNVIFSINNNEDFSHDAFHFYAGKVRTNSRNNTVEEGFAYSWGNSYYVDSDGEMVSQAELLLQLQRYLKEHPALSLIELFNNNQKVLRANAQVHSLISSLICDEVERKKGRVGILALLNCGAGDKNFFRVVNDCVGINQENFNEKLTGLISNYGKN